MFKSNRSIKRRFSLPVLTPAQSICLVVGSTCIVGFLIDVAVLGAPFILSDLGWRIDFLQQIGRRSIIFLFGVALLMYCAFDQRQLKRALATFCLVIGVVSLVSSIVVIHDSLETKNRTFQDISEQAVQIQSRIDDTRESGNLPPEITLSELEAAAVAISEQAEAVKLTASKNIVKASASTIGNLAAFGLGMIGLSRVGMQKRRIHSPAPLQTPSQQQYL